MYMSELRESLETAMECRKKVAKTLDMVDRKTRRRIIWIFVLLAILLATDPLSNLFLNIQMARGLPDAQAESEYIRLAIWLSSAQVMLTTIGMILAPWLAKYLFILFGYCYLPVDVAVRYFISRRSGYRDFHGTYKKFMEPNQIHPFQLIVWVIMSIWVLPWSMLWTAYKLDMSQDTFASLCIYLAALAGSALLWLKLNRALGKERDDKSRAELAAWLRNPAGLKDFIDLPLLIVACFVFFGFLVWPALDFTLKEIKQGTAAFFVEELDYEGRVADSRRDLLWLLESQDGRAEKDVLQQAKQAILPPSDGIADSFAFNFSEFRTWRDKTLPHMIPLWVFLTIAVIGIRKLLYFRAAQGTGGARQASRAGGLPW